jgi:hypothetical protein
LHTASAGETLKRRRSGEGSGDVDVRVIGDVVVVGDVDVVGDAVVFEKTWA